MKTTTLQSGKSLTGFIIGLLLATMVIVGVLFFLNKNKTTFKQPDTSSTPSQPEILRPSDDSASNTGSAAIEASSASVENTPADTIPAEPTPQPKPAPSHSVTNTTPAPDKPKSVSKPAHQANKPIPTEKNRTTSPGSVHPEDILNSGSLEKAEQKAQQRAKKNTHPDTGNKVILQIGSYYDQTSADTQRAKLAMLGVDALIRKANVNGRTMYRVQTPAITHNQAQQLSNKLKQNKFDSLMRTAP